MITITVRIFDQREATAVGGWLVSIAHGFFLRFFLHLFVSLPGCTWPTSYSGEAPLSLTLSPTKRGGEGTKWVLPAT